MYKYKRIATLIILLSVAALFVSGCATTPKSENVLAYVDGEPISIVDLEYALEVAHRVEDLSTTRELDISGYVNKLIDDRLVVQEARRMGMAQYPLVMEKVEAYLVRESVVRLYNEEVLQKITVTDNDILGYFNENYERISLDMVETEIEEDARDVLEKLESGEEFSYFSSQYPSEMKKDEDGTYVFSRGTLVPAFYDAISDLKPGEFSGVIAFHDNFYILKLISREAPPAERLESIRNSIEQSIRKKKTKEREDDYLTQLYDNRQINIDNDLMASIQFDTAGEGRAQWMKDNRPLVEIDDYTLTAGRFAEMLPVADEAMKEKVLKRWMDRKVVDLEALSRNYEETTDLREKLASYENQILKNIFSTNVIASRINIKDEDVKDYYLSHQDDYLRPVKYRVQQISVKTREEAEKILDSLKAGASFSWMAKSKSTDTYSSMGGVTGWKNLEEFSEPVAKVITSMEPGEISPVLNVDMIYRIIRLMEKTDRVVEDFERVKRLAHKSVYRQKFKELYDEYLNKLRQEALVEINEDAVNSFIEIFKK